MAGREIASTSRNQFLRLAEKLFLQATSSVSGWCRNCFHRLPVASAVGGYIVSTGCRQPLWVVQKLFPQAASRLCGWCRNCFPRGDGKGKQNLFPQASSSFCSWRRICSHSSLQPLRPGVKAAFTGCRQALRPAPEQAASNVYGGCRSCLHRPETAPETGG